MSLSLSEVVVPALVGGMGTLQTVLRRASAHAEAGALDPEALLGARLRDDMFDFVQQVQAATDTARRGSARLAGVEPSSLPDPERSFDALLERVQRTIEAVKGVDRGAIDRRQEESFVVDLGQEMTFTGRSYALGFAVPNCLFHVSMAYGIMRQQGVALGKIEYIAPFMSA